MTNRQEFPMTGFTLHSQLENDCHVMGHLHGCLLLLHRNSALPWYILVPKSNVNQLHLLPPATRSGLNRAMDQMAEFVLSQPGCEHTNVAAIGNRVPQLHLHVVGRWQGDPCWPGVIWGNLPEAPARSAGEVGRLLGLLSELRGFNG
ncbi:MAG: HIT family protein [Halomonadaceae bacterium]|nr:MAG: HIT family protein [Halomonadaceae bacterium]